MTFFLSLQEVLDFHKEQIDLYGGSYGVRDIQLLESALAQPSSTFDGNYLHKDIFEMGAAYLFHIVQNHPFIDGNKRAGLATCLYFLALNDIEIEVDPYKLERFVRSIAGGEVLKPEIACFLRKYSLNTGAY
ncbi:MAG: type II toxin-antitoxin system death-on-curing family toxin [Synergistaceae bacterium]|nr:type II toxin-antitoxin system death-on-curing family toxin [Synergistaceae bacterium]